MQFLDTSAFWDAISLRQTQNARSPEFPKFGTSLSLLVVAFPFAADAPQVAWIMRKRMGFDPEKMGTGRCLNRCHRDFVGSRELEVCELPNLAMSSGIATRMSHARKMPLVLRHQLHPFLRTGWHMP